MTISIDPATLDDKDLADLLRFLRDALGVDHPSARAAQMALAARQRPKKPCRAFQWVGQSLAHCDGCSAPAWDHDGMEGSGETPFGSDPLPVKRWTPEMIEAWEARGVIVPERAIRLCTLAQG